MKWIGRAAAMVLALIFTLALAADWIAPAPYDKQFRAMPDAPPSRQFPLGLDGLGRDRLSRLLHGTRISLLLAPAAAMVALLVAIVVGGSAGFLGGWWDSLAMRATDLFLSLPWLFLFLTVRALLPLNVAPFTSIVITFGMMGLLGWAAAARVFRAAVAELRNSEFALYARACGCSESRVWRRHLLPHLRVLVTAQFWIMIPVFILGEASLGLLGLGVAEPLPSWGNLLRELARVPALQEYWVLAPVLVLALVTVCFQLVKVDGEVRAS
jgi:peptide/nickel transport system permease protein